MGETLAKKILREWGDMHDIDVVIPIPDTSRTSALELANMLGVKFREGFMKNRYIGRTFIMPGQQQRTKSVRQKLNPVELEFKGKNVLLVDDSIVRGTTCNEIIQMARDAGAKKVYFASAAPMVKYPNVYGIDMPAKAELIASHRSVEEIQEIIGADRLIFQDLDDLKAAVRTSKVPVIQDFDCSVFDGVYVCATFVRDAGRSNRSSCFNESNSYDPQQNIFGGAKYLSWLMKRFNGNTSLALAAYNAGEGNVDKYGGIPPFRETQDYVKRVTSRLNNLYAGGLNLSANNIGTSTSTGQIIAQSNQNDFSNQVEPTPQISNSSNIQPVKYSSRPIIIASDGTYTDAPRVLIQQHMPVRQHKSPLATNHLSA